MPFRLAGLFVVLVMLSPLCVRADVDVVKVGAGSYASDIPANAPQVMHQFAGRALWIDNHDRPIPTNDWWTDAIAQRWAGELWSHPLMARADERGLRLFYPTNWTDDGRDLKREYELVVSAKSYTPRECRVTGWGDWSVDLSMPGEQKEQSIDVTLAHGMPCVWTRFGKGMSPTVSLPEQVKIETQTLRLEDGAQARVMVFEYGQRWWAIVMSGKSDAERAGQGLVIKLDQDARFLVFVALPGRDMAQRYARHALAMPTDTQLDWAYQPERGRVVTTWQVKTQPLLGKEDSVLQGWLPHHLRETECDFEVNKDAGSFATPRGKMRLSVGNRFEIAYPFEGVLPHWPAPPNDDKLKSRAEYYTRGYIDKRLTFAADTYWGGKDLWRAVRYGQMAHEYGLDTQATLFDAVKKELIDWLTYEPGETDRYFAAYPKWGGLVGVNPSYGSEGFNDHHFHYGYFLCTAGLLAMHDPQFAEDYGPMLRLIARGYANWDDQAGMPKLRTFDPWNGHSWAGGMSAGGGNNQESSSEAVQGWAGMIFLGQALDDEQMISTGVMGYAIETRATLEYWFDWKRDNWPEQWKHGAVGMIWSGGQVFGTYFSGDPAWVYAIQWCPPSPVLMYLARDPDASANWLETMWKERAAKEGPGDAKSLGPDLGNMILAYQSLFDPETVAQQHDQWFDSNDPMARDHYLAGLVHLYAHHLQALGRPAIGFHTDCATASVYRDSQGDLYMIAYNLSTKDITVNVWFNGQRLNSSPVAAGSSQVVKIE